MTLLQIILLILGALICAGICAITGIVSDEDTRLRNTLIAVGISVVSVVAVVIVMLWYNTSTASGIRDYSEYKKNLSNGVQREIIIVDSEGEEVYKYTGKVDVEDTKTLFCIYFYDQEGISHIIHYSVTDRVFINEIGSDGGK